MCDKAKEDWISENCAKMEELETQHKTRQVKEVIRTDKRRARNSCITSKEGRELFDQQEIQHR